MSQYLDLAGVNIIINEMKKRALIASPGFTGIPTAPTAPAGTNNTQIATTAFVRTAVTALVGSAPVTLDTLNELATALGNDPNFAATMATQLGLKAPLASPNFSGVPTGPTAATSVNNTQLATTAFVKNVVNDKTVISGNAGTATKLQTARQISITGDASGSASFDGGSDIAINTTVRRVVTVGSDAASSNGWYKVASQTCSGYGNQSLTFMVTSTYGNYHSGILELQVRSDSSSIQIPIFGWLVKCGFDINNFIIVVEGMKWSLYVQQPMAQYGRIMFEIISSSSINSKNDAWGLTFVSTSTKEATSPVATKKSVNIGATDYSNSAGKLSTPRNINGVSFDGSSNITITDDSKIAPTGSIVANRVPIFSDTSGKILKDSGFTIGTSVPAGAKFTDTWRGIQDNLTSTATDQSLSANQGKVLKGLIDEKAPSGFGLGVECSYPPGDDWNNATRNAWIMSFSAANSPIDYTWFAGFVIRHNDSYVIQRVQQFTNSQRWWERNRVNGTWEAWRPDPKQFIQSSDPGTAALPNDIWIDTANNIMKYRLSNGTWKALGASYN